MSTEGGSHIVNDFIHGKFRKWDTEMLENLVILKDIYFFRVWSLVNLI